MKWLTARKASATEMAERRPPSPALNSDYIVSRDERILVTGSNGFIGAKVVEMLLQYGCTDIRCFVRSSTARFGFYFFGLCSRVKIRLRMALFRNFDWGRYRLGLLAAVVLYNWTEADRKTYNPLWFVFYIIPTDYPRACLTAAQRSVGVARSEKSRELASAEEEP